MASAGAGACMVGFREARLEEKEVLVLGFVLLWKLCGEVQSFGLCNEMQMLGRKTESVNRSLLGERREENWAHAGWMGVSFGAQVRLRKPIFSQLLDCCLLVDAVAIANTH